MELFILAFVIHNRGPLTEEVFSPWELFASMERATAAVNSHMVVSTATFNEILPGLIPSEAPTVEWEVRGEDDDGPTEWIYHWKTFATTWLLRKVAL